jgi:pyruvate dehydrogenase E1 component alpha subunit
MENNADYHYFKSDINDVIKNIPKEALILTFKDMLLSRNFEIRAESAYQSGNISGFLHLYNGQEAIASGCVAAFGKEQYYTAGYRSHMLALLLGASPKELMAELYGKKTGNVLGRGGSMHFFLKNMLGGFGIVGGHIPLSTGAGFTVKYKNKKDMVSVCFIGDGAVAQGAFHEALNLASLWDLPCIFVIENNHWGMGTATNRAICVEPIAEKKAIGYNMQSYTLDGMDFFNCYAGFKHIYEQIKKDSRPVLVEALTNRFKGHSISDPGLYRSKEELENAIKHDPIKSMQDELIKNKIITEDDAKKFNDEAKDLVIMAMKYADESPWPDVSSLGEDVFAKDEEI